MRQRARRGCPGAVARHRRHLNAECTALDGDDRRFPIRTSATGVGPAAENSVMRSGGVAKRGGRRHRCCGPLMTKPSRDQCRAGRVKVSIRARGAWRHPWIVWQPPVRMRSSGNVGPRVLQLARRAHCKASLKGQARCHPAGIAKSIEVPVDDEACAPLAAGAERAGITVPGRCSRMMGSSAGFSRPCVTLPRPGARVR